MVLPREWETPPLPLARTLKPSRNNDTTPLARTGNTNGITTRRPAHYFHSEKLV
jgi:hypothetical protein